MPVATATEVGAAPHNGKKRLIVAVAVAAVLASVVAGVLWAVKEQRADPGDELGSATPRKTAAKAPPPKATPVFAPLDPFTVNLADKEADRYAQVGITLELDTAATSDALKVFMPAVRNNILMLLAHKTSAELLGREGKDKLAREVARETSRGLGVEIKNEDDLAPEGDEASTPKKPRKKPRQTLPVTAVYFSTFIIQ